MSGKVLSSLTDQVADLLRQILDSLFRHTPPTALIVSEPSMFIAVVQHLARLGIVAPDDITLACTDMSDEFEWCVPGITHIAWDFRPLVGVWSSGLKKSATARTTAAGPPATRDSSPAERSGRCRAVSEKSPPPAHHCFGVQNALSFPPELSIFSMSALDNSAPWPSKYTTRVLFPWR